MFEIYPKKVYFDRLLMISMDQPKVLQNYSKLQSYLIFYYIVFLKSNVSQKFSIRVFFSIPAVVTWANFHSEPFKEALHSQYDNTLYTYNCFLVLEELRHTQEQENNPQKKCEQGFKRSLVQQISCHRLIYTEGMIQPIQSEVDLDLYTMVSRVGTYYVLYTN